MTWIDPIVEEVRRAREANAARFEFDVGAIVEDAQRRAEASGRRIVRRSPRRPTTLANVDRTNPEKGSAQ